jgi:acyl-coenzyme A synthetase/AMP-(fatty) acid ligase
MSNYNQLISDIIRGPAFPDKEFIRAGATFGSVYGMAAGFRALLASPEYQGAAICVAVDDRAALAALLLAALHPAKQDETKTPAKERATLGSPCPAATRQSSPPQPPTLLLPFALSAKSLAGMRQLTGFSAAISDVDRDFPPGIAIIRPPAGAADAPVSSDRIAPQGELLKIFTGGSTGAPQLWSKTGANLFGEGLALARHFAVTEKDCIVATAPPFHIYGLLFSVILPLVSGASVVMATPSFPGEIADVIAAHRPTLLAAIPPHYRALRGKKVATPSLRLAFSSAGMLDAEDNESFTSLNEVDIVEVYGSTETGGIATRNRRRGETAFTAFPAVSWLVKGDRLCVRSPFLSPELPVTDEGYFTTGDRVESSGANQFILKGRVDGITKVGGKRVDLEEVRAIIKKAPKVSDCVVLALPDPGGREHRIAALVQGAGVDMALLRQTLADSLEFYALPRTLKTTDRIPLQDNGKYDRGAIIGLLETGTEP